MTNEICGTCGTGEDIHPFSMTKDLKPICKKCESEWRKNAHAIRDAEQNGIKLAISILQERLK